MILMLLSIYVILLIHFQQAPNQYTFSDFQYTKNSRVDFCLKALSILYLPRIKQNSWHLPKSLFAESIQRMDLYLLIAKSQYNTGNEIHHFANLKILIELASNILFHQDKAAVIFKYNDTIKDNVDDIIYL